MGTRGFRIWDPISGDVYESKHVKFDETRLYKDVVQTHVGDSPFETSVVFEISMDFSEFDAAFGPSHAAECFAISGDDNRVAYRRIPYMRCRKWMSGCGQTDQEMVP
uniref:Retroviral polymerase SH3-like domain-containing protein n=1 Tax=Strigamia maritima TaxID=126957 RepID=T1INW4_STRMM